MIYRYVSSEGFKFFMDRISLVPEYHALMMSKHGEKMMELLVKCYTIFSPYTDNPDEDSRETKVSIEIFGEKTSLLTTKVYKAAKARYIEDNRDIDVEQQIETEFGITTLLADRHMLMEKSYRSIEDLEMIEKIGKSLKLLYDEKESLIEHISARIKRGEFGEGKRVGGKKLSYIASKNSQ